MLSSHVTSGHPKGRSIFLKKLIHLKCEFPVPKASESDNKQLQAFLISFSITSQLCRPSCFKTLDDQQKGKGLQWHASAARRRRQSAAGTGRARGALIRQPACFQPLRGSIIPNPVASSCELGKLPITHRPRLCSVCQTTCCSLFCKRRLYLCLLP